MKNNSKFSDNSEVPISLCDVMKDNTSKIIAKLESQIPPSAQHYSDLYTLFLHSVDDVFGTCYLAEKQFFDKLGFDQNALKSFKAFSDQFTDSFLTQIEMMTNAQKSQFELQKNLLSLYEQYVHSLVDSYWKSVGNFTNLLESTKKS